MSLSANNQPKVGGFTFNTFKKRNRMFKFSHAVCVVYFAGVMDLYLTPLLSRAESQVSSLSPHETPSDGAQMAVVAKLSPIHSPLHHVR